MNKEAINVVETLLDEVRFQHKRTRAANDVEKLPSVELARKWLEEQHEVNDELLSTIAYLVAEIKVLYCIHYAWENSDLATAGEANEVVMDARKVMQKYGK